MGLRLDEPLNCFAVLGSCADAQLYAGGEFIWTMPGEQQIGRLARWDGQEWNGIPGFPNAPVRSLCAFDDGSGEALFVGGEFRDIGSERFNFIAKWDGVSWQHLGNGLSITGFYVSANAMKVYDDGRGPALYVGGVFTRAGDVDAYGIARWDGQAWESLDLGTSGPVYALEVYDDGDGPALYAAGTFTYAGGVLANHIAKWDGLQWSAVGVGVTPSGVVNAMKRATIAGRNELYVGGIFEQAGETPARNLARWDGSIWSGVGEGIDLPIDSYIYSADPGVYALESYDAGNGEELYIGGIFDASGD
ncbi:MAG: hypothetical protein JNG88_14685, partial [Phycisphaerales bacterium]|nr:hypothetical protein [Phycisphaerales bacterium]